MYNLKEKKIVFFGTPDFCVDFLDLFSKLDLDIRAVVTGEDKPFGRGLKLKTPGPKLWAEKFASSSTQIFQPQKLDDDIYEKLREIDADLFIVIAYGKIIPEKFLSLTKYGAINLHYSLLPKYRGASPVESAILNNEAQTGLTIQQLVYSLDAGDILHKETVEITNSETSDELRERLNMLARKVFPEFLEKLFTYSLAPVPQNTQLVTKCAKFSKADYDVTLDIQNQNLPAIFLKYKAFNRKIFFFKETKGALTRIKISNMSASKIIKVVPEGKNEITSAEFEKYAGKIFPNKNSAQIIT